MIWNVKPKTSVISKGHFNCPQCQKNSPYHRKEINYYRVVLSIPFGRTKDPKLVDYIECNNCLKQFHLSPNLPLDASMRA